MGKQATSERHWVWAIEPSEDAEALIHGTSPVLDRLDLDFESGLLLDTKPGSIEITRSRQFPGSLTENVHVSDINGLLFSARLRQLLEAASIDNIQYWPTLLRNPADGSATDDYHLANIVGRVSCLDRENSVLEMDPEEPETIEFIEVLAIDETKARGFDLFRLHEDPHYILASDRVRRACELHEITGVAFYEPRDYPY